MTEHDRQVLAAEPFGDMFKLVVDITRLTVTVGGDFHAEGESLMLAGGARQEDLWGANYYPARPAGLRLEYSALINIRPARNNRGHLIESEEIKKVVREVVARMIGPI